MSITVNNHKPSSLNSFYLDTISKDFNLHELIRDTAAAPLYQQLVPSAPVQITYNGKDMSADDITNIFLSCSEEQIQPDAEETANELMSHVLSHYNDKTELAFQDVYAIQAAQSNNVIFPEDNARRKVVYCANDVIDTAKQFLAYQASPEKFFATMAFYTRVSTFGYYFANNDEWIAFKKWFATEIQAIMPFLDPKVATRCNELQKVHLNRLTEAWVLRNDRDSENEPYSFARILVFYLMTYERMSQQNGRPPYTAGHMPFSFIENFCPTTIVIVNVEKHAHAHVADVQKEWNVIKSAMMAKPKVLNFNQIQQLTIISRMAEKMKMNGAGDKHGDPSKSAVIRFRKTPPTSVDLYSYIERIYKHTTHVQMSENAVKMRKMTYNKPSRRDPDNLDKPGVTKSVKYKPDLHIYLDCSGSISERNYQDAIKACIKLAKKLGINFYFNSFSNVMSRTAKLPIAGKTTKQIYEIFKNIPKVDGGTDYEQIWHYINKSKVLSGQVSIVITDFEYYPPSHYVKHPKYLYYAPISAANWQYLVKSAEDFTRSMHSICPDTRKHILM